MTEKYAGHWYTNNCERGSGYRSVSFDHRLDPCLLKAAKNAGIEVVGGYMCVYVCVCEIESLVRTGGLLLQTIEKLLEHSRGKIMFVNPGYLCYSLVFLFCLFSNLPHTQVR